MYGRKLNMLKSCQVVNKYQYFVSSYFALKIFIFNQLNQMGVILNCDTKEMRAVGDPQESLDSSGRCHCKLEGLKQQQQQQKVGIGKGQIEKQEAQF